MKNYEVWLRVADENLRGAEALLKFKHFSHVPFFGQQVAEKSLKAYLIFNQQSIAEAYTLVQLIEISAQFDKDFEGLLDVAKYLDPFLTKFRYPTACKPPDFAEAENVIKQAQKVLTLVMKKIPKT